MNTDEAATLMLTEMVKHGLDDWHFEWTRATSFIGDCNHGVQRLRLSKPLTEVNDLPVIIDTILHEIAHALAGASAGHGPEWKAVARRLGASPKATTGTIIQPPKRYRAYHPCGLTYYRNRLPSSNRYCTKCYRESGRTYNSETVIRWTDTRTMTDAGTSTDPRNKYRLETA